MAQMNKWKNDKKLTAMMVEDMLFNPLLAAKVIFRVKLPPHEELRIMWMWTTYYTNDDSGFSTGKSWTFALVSALRAILMKGRVSGILSKTYAQGKLIFAYYDRWYTSSPIFRSCVSHAGGKKRIIHGTDAHVAYFRGGGENRVLPPNFLQDSERIRSERWHDAYLDEWTTYGNFKALNTTIMGRVTNVNDFNNCPVRQNHIHLASTPQFTHHPSYKMIRAVDAQLSANNDNYGRFTCNYRHVPDTPEWSRLIARKVIFHMQTNLPMGVVKSEVDGIWSQDSASYYSSFVVDRARMKQVPLMVKRTGHDGELFFCGFDVARGGSDHTGDGQGDDFSLTVWRVVVGQWIPHQVLTVRKNKITDIQMSGLIHKFHKRFNFSFIVYDPGGGGLFVKDKLKLENQFIDNEMVACMPIIAITDNSAVIGDTVLVSFSRNDWHISQMWGKMASDSVLTNRLHKEFKGALENRKAILSGEWSGWTNADASWDVGRRRDYLNKNPEMDEDSKYKAEMDLAVSQLILVDYERDADGNAKIDHYGMYKFTSKEKKDSAYGMIYGYCGVLIWMFLQSSGMDMDSSADKSDVACSVEEI